MKEREDKIEENGKPKNNNTNKNAKSLMKMGNQIYTLSHLFYYYFIFKMSIFRNPTLSSRRDSNIFSRQTSLELSIRPQQSFCFI